MPETYIHMKIDAEGEQCGSECPYFIHSHDFVDWYHLFRIVIEHNLRCRQ